MVLFNNIVYATEGKLFITTLSDDYGWFPFESGFS